MASLQKTFKYKGDANNAPYRDILMEVEIPLFSYYILPTNLSTHNSDYVNFQREIEGFTTISSNLKLGKDEYQVNIPTKKIVGDNINSKYGFFRFHEIESLGPISFDKFAFDIKIKAKDTGGNEIETIVYEALYGIQFSPKGDALRGYSLEKRLFINDYGTLEDPNEDSVDKLIKIEEEKDRIFLINKQVFDSLKEKIVTIIEGDRINLDRFLLFLIEGFIDLSGDYPKIAHPIEGNRDQWLNQMMMVTEIGGEEKEKAVKDLIFKHFDKLLDFPISIPEIKTVEVKGNFTIDSEEEVKKSHLEFYNLSVEYPQNDQKFKVLRYDWSKHESELDNKSTSISFTKEHPITLNSVLGTIRVLVKGFDGTVLWSEEFYPDDPTLQELDIKVPLYIPGFNKPDSTKTNNSDSKKMRGRVLQLGKKYDLNELTVLIQAKKEGDELFRIIGSAQTDSSGNFSLPYSYGVYKEAQAIVSLMPNSPADIEVSEKSEAIKNLETISDDFIFLLLQEDEVVDQDECKEDEDDCGCQTTSITTKRLPDQADLIESGEYTQDLGGTCMNLSTPNRTLREYNYNAVVRISDPDVANYTLKKRVEKNKDGTTKNVFDLVGGKNKIIRSAVDLDNPIRWENSPDSKSDLSLYQAVTVATGHIIHFKSIFKADGYSLGDLIYSLPLAPGQKKQIVVMDSSHSFTGSETQSISQEENLSASLFQDRFITDEIGGRIGESLSGRSSASTSGLSAGLGAAVSYAGIGASLGVAGGFSNSNSSASQNSSRNVSQYFDELLKQQITQRAESFRELNASVVTTVSEGQQYGVTAETIANHNHCHSLTMMYFEVLRHYAIFQEVSHVEECIFVPLLMTNFTIDNIHKWKDVLATNLLPIPSNTYINQFSFLFSRRNRHPLLKAFDANERLKTNYSRVDFPMNSYAEDEITHIRGRLSMNVNIPRPKTKYDRILSLPVTSKIVKTKEVDVLATADQGVISGVIGSLFGGAVKYKTKEEEVLMTKKIFDSFMSLDANFQNRTPAQCIRIVDFTPQDISVSDGDGNTVNITTTGTNFFENDNISEKLWNGYANILEMGVWELLNGYFKGRLISEWDSIFYNELLPSIFSKIIDSITITGLNLDFSSSVRYKGGHKNINVNFSSTGALAKTREQLSSPSAYLDLKISPSIDAVVIESMKNHVKLNIGKVSIDYETEHFRGTLYRGYVNDDLLDGTSLYIPLTSTDKRNPRKEDVYLIETLIEHLNSNLEHYNKILWYNLDADRRYMLLDGFNIETYNSFGQSTGFRSLASIVKNQLITVAGNSLVLPVADGYKVSQSFIMEDIGEGVEQEVSLLDYYKPYTPIPPYRISVPTKGVFMEAIMGQCDACEMVKENSSQDWDRFKTEETTSIQSIITPTPTITEYNPQYKEFANPLVSIQNAPDTPLPGVGLNKLTELLGKAGVFNDITGLSGTQDNAIKTYLSNQENAKAFAEMASNLAGQQHNTKNSEGITKGIKQAQKDGSLSEADSKQLMKKHLEQQIGGTETDNEKQQHQIKNINDMVKDGTISKDAGQKLVTGLLENKINAKKESSSELGDTLNKIGGGTIKKETNKDGTANIMLASLGNPRLEKCGFVAKDSVVSKANLINTIIDITNDEHTKWKSGGTVVEENDPASFKKLVIYCLSVQLKKSAGATPNLISQIQNKILAYPDLTVNSNFTDVSKDIQEELNAKSSIATKIRQALNNAKVSSENTWAWSSVFVTYCVRQAALNLGIEYEDNKGEVYGEEKLLEFGNAHSQYSRPAYIRRNNEILGCYHAFRKTEKPIEIGDIIILDRRSSNDIGINDVRTYTDLSRQPATTHGDIVVEIDEATNSVITIGGNVGNSVRKRRYPITDQGFLDIDNDNQRLYSQEEDDGNLSLTSISTNADLQQRSTTRIFAVLKLVEECLVVPGTEITPGAVIV